MQFNFKIRELYFMNTNYSDITLEINGILSAPYKDGDILKNRYRILSQDSGGQFYGARLRAS